MNESLEADAIAERNFHARLLDVDADLHPSDLHALKFLLKDSLPKTKLKKISTGHELFTEMEKSMLISLKDPWLLVEIFLRIGRDDLVDSLALDMEEISEEKPCDYIPTGKVSPYRYVLFDIAQDLTNNETAKLCFLADKISKAKKEKITSPLDLLSLMEESKQMSPSQPEQLREYMVCLSRFDLVARLDLYVKSQSTNSVPHVNVQSAKPPQSSVPMDTTDSMKTTQSQSSQTSHSAGAGQNTQGQAALPDALTLDMGRRILEHPVESQFELWKHLGYEECELQRIQEASIVSDEAMTLCSTMLRSAPTLSTAMSVGQALTKIVNALRFAKMEDLSQQIVGSHKDHFPPEFLQEFGSINTSHSNTNQPNSIASSINSGATCSRRRSLLQTYKMNAKPRGICVIFNNTKFPQKTPDGLKLGDRQGTNIDKEKLAVTFNNLKFDVIPFEDLSAGEIILQLRMIGKEAVRPEHDCFVCCVLTHGCNNQLYGSDSKLLNVKDLQVPFKSNQCPNLAGKPKLFFLQACQGRSSQGGMEVESDSPQNNGKTSEVDVVPNEADFLIGYATVPGFVSYRSKSQGSWYITTLTEILDKMADKEDILAILTEVNRVVGMKMADIKGRQYKQIPAPQYTLRKRLIFPKLP